MNSNTTKIYFLGAKVDRVFGANFFSEKIFKFLENKTLSFMISFKSKLVTSYARRWGGR